MKTHPAALLIGDVTEFGVVKSIKSSRHNNMTVLTFEDGTQKSFFKYAEVEVLSA